MTIVDGVETTLPPEKVADLQPKVDPEKELAKEPEKPVVEPEKEPAKPAVDEPKEPEKPVVEPEKSKKATPFATLLAKKHDTEVLLEKEREAHQAEMATLQDQIKKLSERPASAATDNKVKALAEKYNIDEGFVQDMLETAKESIQPVVPEEVKILLAERAETKAIEAEEAAALNRIERLQKSLPGEKITENQDKLLELAYSDEVAPDGERYDQKELAELYFSYIKPEIEPGKPSGEESRGGTRSGSDVIDFQEIFDRDDPKEIAAMNDKTFQEYTAWQNNRSDLSLKKTKYI